MPLKLAPLDLAPSQKSFSSKESDPSVAPRSFSFNTKTKGSLDIPDVTDIQGPISAGRRSLPSESPVRQDSLDNAPFSPITTVADTILRAISNQGYLLSKESQRDSEYSNSDDAREQRTSQTSIPNSVRTSERQQRTTTKTSAYSVVSGLSVGGNSQVNQRNPSLLQNVLLQRLKSKMGEQGATESRSVQQSSDANQQSQETETVEEDIRLPSFSEYPFLRTSPRGVYAEHNFHQKGVEKEVKSFLSLFDKKYPAIVPHVENEAVVTTLLRLHPNIKSRQALRFNLSSMSRENICLFLLHSSRMGDIQSLTLLISTPFFNIQAVDDEGRTALIFAAIGGHAKCIQLLLQAGAYVNHQDKSGRTALHWAAYYGHLAAVKELLDHKADYQLEDFLGRTILHCATYPECTEVLEFLVKVTDAYHRRRLTIFKELRRFTFSGTNMNVVSPEEEQTGGLITVADCERMTPLMWAAYYGHDRHIGILIEAHPSSALCQDREGKTALHWTVANRHGRCVELLLAKFPTLMITADKMGRLPLHVAAACGNPVIVELILKAPGAHVNALDTVKRTPLHWAASSGHVSCINVLCKAGAAIDAIDDYGASSLHYAILYGRTDCVHVLLRKGSSINVTDGMGRVPIMWACIQGHSHSLKMLLKANVKLGYKDKLGLTALHMAATSGSMECCTALIRSGADVFAKDKGGQTPIFKATIMGWDSIVIFLMNEGARIDEQDLLGRTLSHYAARIGYLRILQILVSQGAAVHLKSNAGRTPLHKACMGGFTDIVSLLIKRGDNINDQDEDGRSALHYAAMNGWDQVCSILLENGADPNQLDSSEISKSKTPLDLAMSYSSSNGQLIEALKKFGCLTSNELASVSAERIQRSWRKHKTKKANPGLQTSLNL